MNRSLEASVKIYKRELDRHLRHIKLILARERHNLPTSEWRQLVHETKNSILRAPQDFLCKEIPSKSLFYAAIEKAFEGFLEDQRLLSLQKQKTYEKAINEKNGRRFSDRDA